MITLEQIPQVLDHPVYDNHGARIGEAKHVFVDDVTGQPDWVTVRTGLFGRNESFVPVRDAAVVQDHLEVPFDKSTVKDAPKADIDAGGHLSEQEERKLYRYYGLSWEEPGARTTGPQTTGGTAGTAATAGRERRAATGDEAMTRSEEEMRVGVERRATGRARLRKYVVTEEVQKTVPVRHEEVRVEREPITEENIDEAMRGPEISEAEHEVTLHEERPVVETEVVPKERVRLGTEEVSEEETVRGEIRKERIKGETTEGQGEGEGRGRHRRS